ncbi:MAG: triose-phosphate isomerase [bacterium]|nr:triose-phosphate isomerase [bacterium]
MLVINFKTYHESTGANALLLAKLIDQAALNAPTEVLIAVQALDLESCVRAVKNVKVIAQTVDAVGYGAHTGHILPEEIKSRGIVGTLINHSEYPKADADLGASIALAQAVFQHYTIVCSPSYQKTVEIERQWDPDKIAFEPPELIGGDISVSSAQPDIIKKVVEISPQRQILVGAGVKTLEDVKVSLDLGAIGVLVASGVVKAADPAAVVKEFLKAWK